LRREFSVGRNPYRNKPWHPLLLKIFRETDREDRFALVARAADGPQAEVSILWLAAPGFDFLQDNRESPESVTLAPWAVTMVYCATLLSPIYPRNAHFSPHYKRGLCAINMPR
jgi:hypothetical protein